MSLLEFNWHPSDRQLKQFGVISLVALPLLGWSWGGRLPFVVSTSLGIFLGASGFLFPALLRPFFVGIMALVTPIGIVVGELALLLIYFGVFLPLAVVFKVVKRDSLDRTLDPACESYWQKRKSTSSVSRYFRQS